MMWPFISVSILAFWVAIAIWLLAQFFSLPKPIKIAAIGALELIIIGAMVFHMRFHKQEMEKLTDE